MSDKLAEAMAHIKRITTQYDPWTGRDICNDEYASPTRVDDAIAVILNAVVSGRLRIVEESE